MKKMVFTFPILVLIAAGAAAIFPGAKPTTEAQPASRLPYWNPSLPGEKRVFDLVSRMTLEEKISQMRYDAPAIERLGIPQYNWWNECLHGVARAGLATV
ncbi:MAG: glucan 1,4-alpha-glucosidase, partial [Candidatus Aminicenantales bacterium]